MVVSFGRPVVKAALCLGMVAALSPLSGCMAAGESWDWEAIGPGGGGRFLGIGISPHPAGPMFSISDMGGAYRSENGGASWSTIPFTSLRAMNFEISQPQNVWAFHPTDANLVFGGSRFGFYRSSDAGKHWQNFDGVWTGTDWKWQKGPRVIGFDAARPDFGLAAFNPAGKPAGSIKFCVTHDRGQTWQPLSELPGTGGNIIDVVFEAKAIIAAATNGVFRSEDGGRTWAASSQGLQESGGTAAIYSFCAGMKGEKSWMYVTQRPGDGVAGGIFRTSDGGKNWQPVGHTGLYWDNAGPGRLGLLATSDAQPETVYLSMTGAGKDDPNDPGQATVYRSDDAGETWQPVLFQNPEMRKYNIANTSWATGAWGWARGVSGLAVNPANPMQVVVTTITSVYTSENGGKTWRQVHAATSFGKDQPGGGMQIMSVWNYYFDPHDPNHQFAAMTDFSGWQSPDNGRTWQIHNTSNPWHNNTYALALDPAVPGQVWAACSVTHDIPTWKYLADLGKYVGGVVNSSDGGKTWTPVKADSGLPKDAVTDIWLDAQSPVTARHLWAAVPGHGAYLSTDGGRSWKARNSGIAAGNLNVLRIGGDGRGKLYALTTMKMPGNRAGALYSSTDEGASWQLVFSRPECPLLTTFTVDPNQADVVYVSSLQTDPYKPAGGSLWKISAGQAQKIREEACYAVSVDPKDSNTLYASSWANQGDGVHVSHDGGATWQRIENYPFWRPLKVVFDPRDSNTLYVTNFGGGVFRGHRLPAAP